MRILIVEDDAALALFLKKALSLEGHSVTHLTDGASALAWIQEEAPDLVLLDLGLPHMDGMEVLKRLQDRVPGTSFLVLTGRTELSEKVECLNLGADDYLLKPFSLFELIARCGAIRRRRSASGVAVLQHGGLRMDRIQRTVTFHGAGIDFTTKEFTLLEYLLQQKGRAVSRRELLENVWHMAPDAGTNVVDVYVNYLRRKLSAAGAAAIVETMRGEGYGIAAKMLCDPRKYGVARALPVLQTTLEVA